MALSTTRQRSLPALSASIKAIARMVLTRTINEGKNQKLARRLLKICLSLSMRQSPSSAFRAHERFALMNSEGHFKIHLLQIMKCG